MIETAQTPRLTSSLNEVRNDTGRIAFRGPYVLSAVTGYSISKVEDVAKVGDKMRVKCIAVDDRGRIKLSMKEVSEDASGGE